MSKSKWPTIIKALWWAIPGIIICLAFIYKADIYSYIKASKKSTPQYLNGAPIECEPSIKSLEQELKICFRTQDKCIELYGHDVDPIIAIVNCEEQKNYWSNRAYKEAKRTNELIDKLHNCKTDKEILLEPVK